MTTQQPQHRLPGISARMRRIAIARVLAGDAVARVAADVGCHETTVRYHLRQAGIWLGEGHRLRSARPFAAALAAGAETAPEVATVSGRTRARAMQWAKTLAQAGYVETCGRRGNAMLWRLTEAGRAWLEASLAEEARCRALADSLGGAAGG